MREDSEEPDELSPKVGLTDGDSEQENRDKPLTAQKGDDEPGASVGLDVSSDRFQDHNHNLGHPVAMKSASEVMDKKKLDQTRAGPLDLDQITSIIGGPRRHDGNETADEERVWLVFWPGQRSDRVGRRRCPRKGS
jgi:hypothetical protein